MREISSTFLTSEARERLDRVFIANPSLAMNVY